MIQDVWVKCTWKKTGQVLYNAAFNAGAMMAAGLGLEYVAVCTHIVKNKVKPTIEGQKQTFKLESKRAHWEIVKEISVIEGVPVDAS